MPKPYSDIPESRYKKNIKVPLINWEVWKQAAIESGMSRNAFIIIATDHAARTILEDKGIRVPDEIDGKKKRKTRRNPS